MRRLLSFVMLLAVCWGSAAQASGIRDLAPADEYFGRMKMSVLGIRNALNTLEQHASYGDRNASSMSGQLALVDDAMSDWRAKYPRDSWLSGFYQKRARVASMIAVAGGGRRFSAASDMLRMVVPRR